METECPAATEHLFRHEAGKMVATLTGIFGIEQLTLAEDVVQEALVRAPQTWPFYGGAKESRRLDHAGVPKSRGRLRSGEFESRLNHARAAAGHFRKSLQLAEIKSEQAFLAKRLRACEDQSRV